MKGIELSAIGLIIIALFSVALMLLLFAGPVSGMANKAFCFVFRVFTGNEAELPVYCQEDICNVRKEKIDARTREEAANNIAAYAIDCYNKKPSPCPKAGTISNCYQLIFTEPLAVTEIDITKALEKSRTCVDLPNNMIGGKGSTASYPGTCGTEDKLIWEAEKGTTIVFVTYELTDNTVVIR